MGHLQVSGDKNEEQVLNAIEAYTEHRPEITSRAINLLFDIARIERCNQLLRALKVSTNPGGPSEGLVHSPPSPPQPPPSSFPGHWPSHPPNPNFTSQRLTWPSTDPVAGPWLTPVSAPQLRLLPSGSRIGLSSAPEDLSKPPHPAPGLTLHASRRPGQPPALCLGTAGNHGPQVPQV